jgi:uncharacterized protein YbcI
MLRPPGSSHPERSEATIEALSREVLRIHARIYGCTPISAETTWDDGVIVCAVEGVLTTPEQSLVEQGRFDRVREDRLALRDALEPTYRALVETLTGRPVRSYMTDISAEDVAFEVFVLGTPAD